MEAVIDVDASLPLHRRQICDNAVNQPFAII